jgi:hypothetical protein
MLADLPRWGEVKFGSAFPLDLAERVASRQDCNPWL